MASLLLVGGCVHPNIDQGVAPVSGVCPMLDAEVDAVATGRRVHTRAQEFAWPHAALDPTARYLGVGTKRGANIYSLASGQELYGSTKAHPSAWGWLGPGRVAFVSLEQAWVVDLDARKATTIEIDAPPRSFEVDASNGALAWIEPETCPTSDACEAELVWSELMDSHRRRWALGSLESLSPNRVDWLQFGQRALVRAGHEVRKVSRAGYYRDLVLVGGGGRARLELGPDAYPTVLDARRLLVSEPGRVRLLELRDDGRTEQRLSFASGGTRTPIVLGVDPEIRQVVWRDEVGLHVTSLASGELVHQLEHEPVIAAAVIPDADCGLVVVEEWGRLRWEPTSLAGGPPRARGLVRERGLRVLGGSIDGELEAIGGGRRVRWSAEGWRDAEPRGAAWREGGWLVEPRDDGVALRRDTGLELTIAWPALDSTSATGVQHSVMLDRDGDVIAVSSSRRGTSGRLVVHELPDAHATWSRELQPEQAALAVGSMAVWLVESADGRAQLVALELGSGRELHRWSTEPLAGELVALAVIPGSGALIGLVEGARTLPRWSVDGDALAPLAIVGDELVTLDPSREPVDPRESSSRWLRVSQDGALLILDVAHVEGDELVRLDDGRQLVTARHLVFADEPGAVLWSRGARVGALDVEHRGHDWWLDTYEGGEWVWSDAAGLRDMSARGAEAAAPRIDDPMP